MNCKNTLDDTQIRNKINEQLICLKIFILAAKEGLNSYSYFPSFSTSKTIRFHCADVSICESDINLFGPDASLNGISCAVLPELP